MRIIISVQVRCRSETVLYEINIYLTSIHDKNPIKSHRFEVSRVIHRKPNVSVLLRLVARLYTKYINIFGSCLEQRDQLVFQSLSYACCSTLELKRDRNCNNRGKTTNNSNFIHAELQF